MPMIYAMSDIHGCHEAMLKSLDMIYLEPLDHLVFVGDYVDGGDKSFQVLTTIMNFEKEFPQQVTVLWGNHDEWLSNWLFSEDQGINSYACSVGFKTVSSFFSEAEIEEIIASISQFLRIQDRLVALNDLFRKRIVQDTRFTELLEWIKNKSNAQRYFETENQIFVHAGIDEELGEYWKVGTADYLFTRKFPATTGSFYKDIISGHIYSDTVARDKSYLGSVYWDGYNHFFIDGNTIKSGIVPILKYDIETYNYSSFNISRDTWEECIR
ncbi:hypothetical protein BAU15_14850 [Enterococcus sp. JM4C]|uniref:metallophosphoesterase n=1 Tax=Candidatus Enterococcus huntleyi TaxID=1857217 RepID=UPI00137B33D8|nr:metallophosphoesterase [Enterococcus sp. JM4C]KAF1296616.1 hypothetical protein BAU15_14850 [Enterococcus sp. JM4C]